MARKEQSENTGRLRQIALTYKMTRKVDPKVGLILAGLGVGIFAVLLIVGFVIGHPVYSGVLGFLLAFLAMAIMFGRRAERAAFGQMEGKPGAAAAVLENAGRGWTVTPAVQINRSQDVVHRAVGKAGIVLVGEGNPNRVKSLLAAEKRRMSRVAVDAPVTDMIVGDGEGEVPLRKIRAKLLKLPRVLAGPKVTEVNDRLKAMGDTDEQHADPQGPDAPQRTHAARQDALTTRRPHVRGPGTTTVPGPLGRLPVRDSACAVSCGGPRTRSAAGFPCGRSGSAADLDGAGRLVVQAASVAVPDGGGDHQQQQDGTDDDREHPGPPAAEPDHPQAQQALAGRGAGGGDQEQADHAEHHGRPVVGGRPVVPGDQAVGDQQAQGPVDAERDEAPAGAGDRTGAGGRQAEPLTAVAEVGAHLLGRLAGAGEP